MQLGLKQSRQNHDNGMETLVSPIPPIDRVVSLDKSKDTRKATRGWSQKGIGFFARIKFFLIKYNNIIHSEAD